MRANLPPKQARWLGVTRPCARHIRKLEETQRAVALYRSHPQYVVPDFTTAVQDLLNFREIPCMAIYTQSPCSISRLQLRIRLRAVQEYKKM